MQDLMDTVCAKFLTYGKTYSYVLLFQGLPVRSANEVSVALEPVVGFRTDGSGISENTNEKKAQSKPITIAATLKRPDSEPS